jgi:chromosome segregation protein
MFQAMQNKNQLQARMKSLKEIRDNYSGYYLGVKSVLTHKNELSGIVGSVAEMLSFDKKYNAALDVALGGSAQSIIVENENAAKQAIGFLNRNRAGRATFLPITTIKKREIHAAQLEILKKTAGFVGIASDLVEAPTKIETIVKNLLGITIIAENLDTATAIAQMIRFQYRVVSLDGDVMNPGGSMTGGKNKSGHRGNLFSSGQELFDLEQQVKPIEQALIRAEKDVEQAKNLLDELGVALDEVRKDGEDLRVMQIEEKNHLSGILNDIARLEEERDSFAASAEELSEFLEDYESRKEELEAKLAENKERQIQIEEEIKTARDNSAELEEKKNEATQHMTQIQAGIAVTREQIHQMDASLREKQAELNEIKSDIHEKENELTIQKQTTTTNVDSKMTLEEQIAEFNRRVTETKESIDKKTEQKNTLSLKIDELTETVNTQQSDVQNLMKEQNALEIKKSREDVKLEQLLKYLQEEYQMTFEKAETEAVELEDVEETRKVVRGLKKDITDLGSVNIEAIEQYQLVNERYTFLKGQRDDLNEAKAQLFETMDEMDVEVKKRFKETFDDIRKHFAKTFPSMFGGGRAELVLTDPDDLLNTGVEIEAEPPGKRLQSLSLLSGGERALTAIALLFSIIQVRPVPFCVLDEVEAALDEANVSRFGHYLSHFDDDTQFIVVTHRKGTMESADVLYGVTMQESGVSKIVSVRLEEVADDGKIATNKK